MNGKIYSARYLIGPCIGLFNTKMNIFLDWFLFLKRPYYCKLLRINIYKCNTEIAMDHHVISFMVGHTGGVHSNELSMPYLY